jgi:hypothetical protein
MKRTSIQWMFMSRKLILLTYRSSISYENLINYKRLVLWLHSCKHLKVKVKLSLCFNWAPCCEGVLGEWRYSSTHSLTSALDGSELSASHLGCFTPRERAPGIRWTGGWVGPRAILDAVVKRKIPSSHWELNPRKPIVQPIAQHYTDSYHGSSCKRLWKLKILCSI